MTTLRQEVKTLEQDTFYQPKLFFEAIGHLLLPEVIDFSTEYNKLDKELKKTFKKKVHLFYYAGRIDIITTIENKEKLLKLFENGKLKQWKKRFSFNEVTIKPKFSLIRLWKSLW